MCPLHLLVVCCCAWIPPFTPTLLCASSAWGRTRSVSISTLPRPPPPPPSPLWMNSHLSSIVAFLPPLLPVGGTTNHVSFPHPCQPPLLKEGVWLWLFLPPLPQSAPLTPGGRRRGGGGGRASKFLSISGYTYWFLQILWITLPYPGGGTVMATSSTTPTTNYIQHRGWSLHTHLHRIGDLRGTRTVRPAHLLEKHMFHNL